MAKIVDNVSYDISTLPTGSTANNNNSTIKMVGNATYGLVKANKGRKSGKWYWEVSCDSYNHTEYFIYNFGIIKSNETPTTFPTLQKSSAKIFVGDKTTSTMARKDENVNGIRNITTFGVNANFNTGSVIGLLLNLDEGTITIYKNGLKIETAFSNLDVGQEYVPIIVNNSGTNTFYAETTTNFGAKDFKFIPNDLPRGTKAYEGWMIKEYAIVQNTTTQKHYSLSDNILIHLPNSRTESIIEHGVEQGKFIQLDVPFTKHRYFNDTPVNGTSGKVFTHDIGKNNTISIREVN